MATHTNRVYGSSRNGLYGYYRKTHQGKQICSDFFYGKNKTEIDLKITTWLARDGWEELLRLKAGFLGEKSTLGDHFERWMLECKDNVWHPNTYQTYNYDYVKHIKSDAIFMALPFNDISIDKSAVLAFRNRIQGSDNTKLNVMKIVHKFFNNRLELEAEVPFNKKLFRYNPASKLPNPLTRSKSRVKQMPKDNERTLFLFAMSEKCSPYWRAFTMFALETGARREEILGVQPRDIDFTTGQVFFQRTVVTITGLGPQVFEAAEEGMKTTSSERDVFLSDIALNALKGYLGGSWPHYGHVFGWDPDSMNACDGTLWTASRLDKAWASHLKAAGVAKIGLNTIRHRVVNRLKPHFALVDVAAQMGHGDTNTTIKNYMKADDETKLAVAKFNKQYFEAMFNQ